MTNLITYCGRLTSINFNGFDISKVKLVYGFITNCKVLESVDVSSINPTSAHDFRCFFTNDAALKHVTFAENFSPGRDYPTAATEVTSDADIPEGYEGLTYQSSGKTYVAGTGGARVRLTSMFSGCTSLEEIDFADWNLYVTT